MSPDPEGSTVPIRMSFTGAGAAAWNPAVVAAVLLLLVLAGAFFMAGKIAVLSLNKQETEKLAKEGEDKKLSALRVDTARLLSVARSGAMIAGMLAAAVAAAGFSVQTVSLFSFLPFSPSAVYGIATVFTTLVLFCLWVVFGDLIPKKIALSHADTLSGRYKGFFSVLFRLFRPAAVFLSWCAEAVAHLLGAKRQPWGPTATEEEIFLIMEAGRQNGLLNENEKDMISNIFEFSDATADEAMTHRTDVIAVEDTDSIEDAVGASIENGCSRIPVYHGNLDHIIGIIYVKDLLPYVGKPVPAEINLTRLMRQAYFVPQSKPCGGLFTEMRLRKIQIAVVVDEYGGTEGIITMEDLLEAIVGNIQDEYDNEEEEIHRNGTNRFDVEGTTPVDEVSDLLGVSLPEGDYDTIAGLMMEHLGRLPLESEHPQVKLNGLTLTVAAMEERRIARILIEKDMPEKQED